MFSSKVGASRLLIGVVIALVTMKGIFAWLTGSISVAAQAADSLLDLVAGIITFLAVRAAVKPADSEHPYGHGKWEDVAGVAQGVLIFMAGALVVYGAVRRLLTGSIIQMTGSGIVVMVISIAVSLILSRHLRRVARETRSAALKANAANITADIYSAAAVLGGLLAIRFTGQTIIDPIIALGVAGYIFRLGYKSVSQSLAGLVDTRLDPEYEAVIKEILARHGEIASFHKLRTRRSGSQRHADLHLVLNKNITLEKAHQVCSEVEAEVKNRLHDTNIVIHAEPCDGNCRECGGDCAEGDKAAG